MSRLQHFCVCTEMTRVLGPDPGGYITGFDRYMLDREWTLNHADDHVVVQARIDVPTILLAWLKAVYVAMERIRLPDPLPNETVR